MLNVYHVLPKFSKSKAQLSSMKTRDIHKPILQNLWGEALPLSFWGLRMSQAFERKFTRAFTSTKPHQQHQHSKWLRGFKYVPFWKNLLQKSLAWQNRRVFSRESIVFPMRSDQAPSGQDSGQPVTIPSFAERCPEPRIEYYLQRFAPESLENDLATPPSRSAKLMVFPDPKGVRIFFFGRGESYKENYGGSMWYLCLVMFWEYQPSWNIYFYDRCLMDTILWGG